MCNITDATPKVIAAAKVRANIVIHICSSIAWQAGARPVSQPPAPGTEPQPVIRLACAYYRRQARHFFAIGKTGRALTMRPHHEGIRSAGGNAMAVDADLRLPRGSVTDPRLRGDTRGRDGSVREELAADLMRP